MRSRRTRQISTVEIVVQWLDDFEDLILSLILVWERLRLRCLQIGLIAALILQALLFADVWTPLASTLAMTACASVAVWFAGLISAQLLRHPPDPGSMSTESGA